jgi:hypothetical protein
MHTGDKQNVRSGVAIVGIQRFLAWTYKDLKGILSKLVQHWIKLDTTLPPTH